MNKKTILTLIGISVFVLMLIVIVTHFLRRRINPQQNLSTAPQAAVSPTPVSLIIPSPNPALQNLKQKYIPADELPVYASGSANQGVDIESDTVKNSQKEIVKLAEFLPFETTFTASNGHEVIIVIPNQGIQTTNWMLQVHLIYIDFNVPEGTPEYYQNKIAFLEAANHVLSWLSQNTNNASDIIIVWGDKEYIHNRAEQWLTE